jgi:hypothetical protein
MIVPGVITAAAVAVTERWAPYQMSTTSPVLVTSESTGKKVLHIQMLWQFERQ